MPRRERRGKAQGATYVKKRHIGGNLAQPLGKEVHTFNYEGRNTSRDAAPVRRPGGSRGCGIRKAGYVRHGRSERFWLLCRNARSLSPGNKGPHQD